MRTEASKTILKTDLTDLRERLSVVEQRSSSAAPVATGWRDLDAIFPRGGLHPNSLHEWIGLDPLAPAITRTRRWSPPIGVLLHLARQSAIVAARTSTPLTICWIGRRLWPTVQSLMTPGGSLGSDLLSRSFFVDAADPRSRLWAADLAARCPSVLVIADGSGLDMAASRRLQLAAEASGGTGAGGGGGVGGWMVHLARPPWEAMELSAASTRWRIGRDISTGDEPRFRLALLRCKGMRSMLAQDRTFTLQRESCDRLVLVSPAPADRSRQAKIAG